MVDVAPDAPQSSSCATTILAILGGVLVVVVLFMLLSPKSPICLYGTGSPLVVLDKMASEETFNNEIKHGKSCVLIQAVECPFCKMTLGKAPGQDGKTTNIWADAQKMCSKEDIKCIQVDSSMKGGAAPWHAKYAKEGFPTLACFQDGKLLRHTSGFRPTGFNDFIRETFQI